MAAGKKKAQKDRSAGLPNEPGTSPTTENVLNPARFPLESREPKPEEIGIACHRCGCNYLRVIYTRHRRDRRIIRMRQCNHCATRIMTVERRQGDR